MDEPPNHDGGIGRAPGNDGPGCLQGGVRRVRYAGHEGGVPLRFHRWDRTVAFPQRMMVVHFSLVLTEETAGRPAWGRLVETMDREVRAAAIGLPERLRPPAEAGDASREGA